MSGQHVLRHKPIRLHPTIRIPWRAIGRFALDVADVLWLCAIATIGSGLMALVIVLVAKNFYEQHEPDAAVMTVVFGFGLIIRLLVAWAERTNR